MKLKDVLAGMNAVAEGVATTKSLTALALQHHVDMPITIKVKSILFNDQKPQLAIAELMSRTPKPE